MGMFNWVDYECVCPQCHGKVEKFQTKDSDGYCDLSTVSPSSVSNFYSSCEKCGCWVEFSSIPTENYQMVVTGKDRKELHRKNVKITS